MSFEKDIARKVLEEEWPDHPKEYTVDDLILDTKHAMLESLPNYKASERQDGQLKFISVADCLHKVYGEKSGHDQYLEQISMKLTFQDAALHIQLKTEYGREILETFYHSVILIKCFDKKTETSDLSMKVT